MQIRSPASGPRRAKVGVIVCIALIVAAGAVYRFCGRDDGAADELADAWNDLPQRPTIARLSRFGHRPVSSKPPSTRESAELLRLRKVAGNDLRLYDANDARAGIASFLAGHSDDALRVLESCAHGARTNVTCWSDLAAVEIELAAQRGEPQRLANAFGAADRAVQLAPRSPEALFNRAVALERLHLDQPAAVAWRRYLAVESTSGWATEARERLLRLEGDTQSRLWDSAKGRVAKAARDNNLALLRTIVNEFRQDARASAELYTLTDWANAVIRNDPTAAVHLDIARDIGNALIDINGERLLADAVSAIDRANGSTVHTLARAQLAYRRARALYTERDVARAIVAFQESAMLFRAGRSPLSRMADYFVANCQTDLGKVSAALASIDVQLADAPAGYRALRGQLLWQKGTAFGRRGLVYEALQSYRQSLALFENMREEINASYMRAGVITLYAALGRDGEAWRERLRAFRDVSRIGHPRVLQTALETTARAEGTAGRWQVASAFYGLSLEPELEPPNPVVRADASVWRSLMTHRLGWRVAAKQEIDRARATVMALKDPTMRSMWRSRLSIAEALTSKDADPHRAAGMLTEAITSARAHGEVFDLPEILLERGRIWRTLRDHERAIADFEEALETSRERDRDAPDLEIRNSYFAVDDSATEELVDLLDREGEQEALLIAADYNRARSFGTGPPPNVRAISESIPSGTLVVHFTALRDRLLVAEIDRNGLAVRRLPIARAALENHITRLNRQILDEQESEAMRSARELYDILLGSLHARLQGVERLVLIADELIADVPFAALRRPDGRFLVESTVLIHAPSAMVFARSMAEGRPKSNGAMAVGNPRFDRLLWPELSMLPGAEREAKEVGRIHPGALVLTGPDATLDRVVSAMQSRSIIDMACHAVVDSRDPSRSSLLLAATRHDPGTLYLREVAGLSIEAQIVLLASCRTTATSDRAPAATRSFALAFLAAGARNVVGSLWDIEDRAAQQLSVKLHEGLRDGIPSADALRRAQVMMLRSGDPRMTALRSWCGFQLFGAGS